jgi:DNA processing protein
MNDDSERQARAELTYLAEPGDTRLARLVADLGPAEAIAAVKAGIIAGTDDAAAGDLARWSTRLGELPGPRNLERFGRQGIRLVCPGDTEWPPGLDDLGSSRPYALWVRGNADLRLTCLRSVSIVGSRAATAYGTWVASDMAASAAERDWAVVSGAAYGVDAAGHRGALGAGERTVAVLACGVDTPYPSGHAELLDAIAATGAVVSEWPPGRHATRLRFLERNRVIAALSQGTVVVEAGQRSGALNTARHARDLDRCLMAVPGPVTSQQSDGANALIRDGAATLVSSAHDVIETLEKQAADTAAAAQAPHAAAGTAAVLGVLPAQGALSVDAITARAGLDSTIVRASLQQLKSAGSAEQHGTGWRRKQSTWPPRAGYGSPLANRPR